MTAFMIGFAVGFLAGWFIGTAVWLTIQAHYKVNNLRCARWPHCGCEGDRCGEVT